MAQQDAKQLADNIENSWVTDFNAGNAQAVAALFAPDGTLVSANGTVVNGQQAIQDALAATIKAGWPKVTTTVLQANMAGDAAWILGQYTYTGTGPNEGKQLRGTYAKVLTRTGNTWRIRLLIGNRAPTA